MDPGEQHGFGALGLRPGLVAALAGLSLSTPTPIQARAIPVVLAGHDVVGRARTGSGKTLAFALPLLQTQTLGHPSGLIITPTRELAQQVCAVLTSLERGAATALVGGVSLGAQRRALSRGPRVVVGTPGRLVDQLSRGVLVASSLRTVVLDEADEMLRMGFADDVETLLAAAPAERQLLLFSATMPPALREVAARHLRSPVEIALEARPVSVQHIEQGWMRVPAAHKWEVLEGLGAGAGEGTVLVFANTRLEASALAERLAASGHSVACLHGGLDQRQRERALERVRRGEVRLLVATDVAARGIDIPDISLVVNVDLPQTHERYVHRIGRTARAGRSGRAVTLVTPKRKRRLRELASALGIRIPQLEVPPLGDGPPPDWVRPLPADPGVVENLDASTLVLLAGTARHLSAPAVVAALAARGVPRTRIGRIRIGKRTTRVGLPEDLLATLLTGEAELRIEEQTVRFERAR